jgi:tol-pal system protein YbgF
MKHFYFVKFKTENPKSLEQNRPLRKLACEDKELKYEGQIQKEHGAASRRAEPVGSHLRTKSRSGQFLKFSEYIALLIIFSIHTVFAGAEQKVISAKPIKFDSSEELTENAVSAKELQNLLNRIEILEHTVSKQEAKIQALDSMLSQGQTKTINADEKPRDIFDLPGDKSTAKAPDVTGPPATLPIAGVSQEKGTDKKAYDLALATLKDNKLDEAEEKFANFIKEYPQSNLQGNAQFWYGETFFRRNIFDKAAINYLKSYKQFPKGPKAADSLLKLALSLGQINRQKEACSTLEKLDNEFPDRPSSLIKRAKDAKVRFGCK